MQKNKNVKKIYILGIGGSSMQAIASILKAQKMQVSGYDKKFGKYFETLALQEIEVDIVPNLQKIKDCDVLLYSLAFNNDNYLVDYAKKLGKIVINRCEFLKIYSSYFKQVIAISGTHGKSTTTYLTSLILKNANFSATYHIGATSKEFVTGGLYLGNDYFITEACEYRDCFLSISPNIAVVLNIEYDHPDYFTSYNKLLNSFLLFASNIKDNGLLIVKDDLKEIFSRYLISINRCDIQIVSIGDNGDYSYKVTKNGFILYNNGNFIGEFTTNLNGYNIYNNIVSIIIALKYNVDIAIIKQSINKVSGLHRRYEKVGNINGAEIIVDYAHHPSEIKLVISEAKKNCNRLLVCFQPHTYSRTEALMEDFATCFSGADEVIITKTYKSRETSYKKTAFDLFVKVSENVNAKYFDDFIAIAKYLKATLKAKDRLLIVGAGDIDELASMLI